MLSSDFRYNKDCDFLNEDLANEKDFFGVGYDFKSDRIEKIRGVVSAVGKPAVCDVWAR